MTYQIIITEETAANIIIDNNTTNVSISTNEYPITIQYNAVIEQAGGNAYGNANVAAYLASSSLSGNIITSANISGAYILGNGSQLTGLPATYGNANVAANLAAFGSNPISTTGNITAGYFLGNGSQLTGLPATYSNANVQAFLPTYSGNIGELTVNGNLTVTGTTSTVNTEIVNVSESVVGNVDAGNLRTAGQVTATGNITGGNIVSAGQGNIDNILTDAVQFDVTAAEATATAKLNWSSAYGTVSHGLGDGSLLLNGMDLVIYATNGEANTLSRGEVVYISGASGDRAEIKRAAATNDTVSATTIGIVKNDIASGAAGYVTTQGVVENLNLGAFTAGQVVWLSSTPGQFTATQPYAPTHTVFIGVVERANAGNGRLLVRVNNGWELGELHDVKITSPANNQYLKYSTSAGNIWVNAGLDISDDTTPALGGDLAGGAYNISGTGNVSAGNFIGSGQFLTSLTGANVTGTVANATYALNSNAATYASVATFADTANSVAGANVSGTVANAAYATSAGSATTATTANTVTDAAQANITSVGTLTSLSVSGNVNGGNLRTAGAVSATGNITGGNINTGGVVSATGNITGANLVASANLTSTQQTVVGTANIAGGTGNIIISGKNIATDMAYAPDGANAINAALSRVVIGTGWNGNITHSAVQNRLLVQDAFARGNTGTATTQFESNPIVTLSANVTNGSFRQQAVGARVRIGGGSAGNTINYSSGSYGTGTVNSVAGLQPNIDVGNVSPYFLGNTQLAQATLNGGFITVQGGSTVVNGYGMVPGLISGNSAATVTNYIGFTSQLNGYFGSVTGNVYGVYHGSNTTLSTTGITTSNQVRSAPGYYAFYNADDVAQIRLGSLRSYNEYQATPANTTGTVNIDKSLGQVQLFTPTGNVTIGDFQNFVFNASNSQSNIAQTDTVTVIITQGATPYTVTMPTGNASIKYAGGVSTIGVTANAATMISITGTKVGNATTSGTGLYLVTVSSEFS